VVSMGRPERESRPPVGNGPAESISTAIKTAAAILQPSILHHPKAIAPGFAVFLMVKDGHWRRQVYMSLHAATRALERAEANGREARMQLVELVPVTAMPVIVVGGGDR